ncbi:MAG: hypothetical protein JWM12_883, partial [Ilumatobacteraceae bacterium]|nr:hypothetical protein [Ilumatobacteraceae bacterium]
MTDSAERTVETGTLASGTAEPIAADVAVPVADSHTEIVNV